MQRVQKGLAQQMSTANRSGNVGEILSTETRLQYVNGLSGSAQLGAEAARQAAMNVKAHANVSNAEAKREAALAKGNKTLTKFSNIVNTVGSILHDSLGKIVIGTTGALFGLMIQSLLTAKSLAMVGGGGMMGGIGKKLFGGIGGKIKGLGGKIKGMFGGGAEGEAAGGEAVAGETAGGLGAATIGAGLAALVGGGSGLYAIIQGLRGKNASNIVSKTLGKWTGLNSLFEKGFGDIFGHTNGPKQKVFNVNAYRAAHHIAIPTTGTAATVNTKPALGAPSPASQKTVSDVTEQYLNQISDNMSKAVNLLKIIADNSKLSTNEMKVKNKSIPSATSYITGRANA
jgi:biopolymer transport protein ExbB/TolQ